MIQVKVPKYPKASKAVQFKLLLAFFREHERIAKVAWTQTLDRNPELWGKQEKPSDDFFEAFFDASFEPQEHLTEELLKALSPSPCRHDLRGDSTSYIAADTPVQEFFDTNIYKNGNISQALFKAAATKLLTATAEETCS